jgi:hypothetical protein
LKGGYTAKAVDRIDITWARRVGGQSTASFVRKACFAAEVQALKALATVSGAVAVPEVIVSGTPRRSGGERLCKPVLSWRTFDPTLARVHAADCQTNKFDWTWTFDATHLDRLHADVLAKLSYGRLIQPADANGQQVSIAHIEVDAPQTGAADHALAKTRLTRR